jgi:hypothetical protein
MRIAGIIISLIVATVYYVVWPGWKEPELVKQRSLAPRIILRWFHSLSWVLLAAACFLSDKLPAAFAGGVYLIFLLALAQERISVRSRSQPSNTGARP